jgi:hypothetical protein
MDDSVSETVTGLFVVFVFALPLMLMCGSVVFAARSAVAGRGRVVPGAVAALAGVAMLGVVASLTHTDRHYDVAALAVMTMVGIVGGSLMLFGLGPLVPWVLSRLGRNAARLPRPLGAAVRDVADRLPQTAAPVALAMTASACAVALTIFVLAGQAQSRAEDIAYDGRVAEPSTDWYKVVAALIVLALVGALAAAGRTPAMPPPDTMPAVRDRPMAPRLFTAYRAGVCAVCGVTMGAAAGYVAGALLRWPVTAVSGWVGVRRTPFDTPWWFICALVVGLPVLAAGIAALLPPRRAMARVEA